MLAAIEVSWRLYTVFSILMISCLPQAPRITFLSPLSCPSCIALIIFLSSEPVSNVLIPVVSSSLLGAHPRKVFSDLVTEIP